MELASAKLNDRDDNKDDKKTTDMGLASDKTNDQGIHECEVWTIEAEGHKQWERCKKNPGHLQFIPAKQFSFEHLPEAFRDEEVFEYVRLMIERTAKLVVNYTSLDRPPGYPFRNYGGTDIPHTGSGFLYCYEYDEVQFSDDIVEQNTQRRNSTEGPSFLLEDLSFEANGDCDEEDDSVNVSNIVGEMVKETGSPGEGDSNVKCLNLEGNKDIDVKSDSVKPSDINVDALLKDSNGKGKRNCQTEGLDSETRKGIHEAVDGDGDDANFKIYEYFDLNDMSCPCPECKETDAPRRQWGYVFVYTAKHVVYDTSEAEKTIVEVNFNDDNQDSGVRRLYGINAISVSNQEEWTIMKCVTHDRDLWVKLYKTYSYLLGLKDRVHEKYWKSPSRLCLIVSHPHGWIKQVTVGKWIKRRVLQVDGNGDELSAYAYDTATCKGSSGASVLILGMRGAQNGHRTWLSRHHVHSGYKGKYNVSGVESERNVEPDDQADSDGDGSG